MLNMFINDDFNSNTHIKNSTLERTLELVSRDLDKLKSYTRNFYPIVSRPNPLINLLNMMEIGPDLDTSNVIRYLDSNAIYISKQIGVSSNINKGDILDSVVTNSKEIFLYTERYNPFEINKNNYMNLETIRCIYTTSDIPYMIHPKKANTDPDDYFIYEIDILALGLQYHFWAKDRMSLPDDYRSGIDIADFLSEIPFINVINSITNVGLITRVFNILSGFTPTEYKLNTRQTFNISNNLYKLDDEYKSLLDNLEKRSMLYSDFLINIPLINYNSLEALTLNTKYFNNYNRWVLLVSRLPIINNLLNDLPVNYIKRNKNINSLKITLKRYSNSNTITNIPDPLLYSTTIGYINSIITIIKEKS